MQGFILEVNSTPAGDELDFDHVAGVTTLQLVDVSDFITNDGTGSLEIEGTEYTYDTVDTATNTLVIGAPLAFDTETGTRVNLAPQVIEKWAMVEVKENDDVVLALVPHALYDRLDDGVRDPEEQEPVIVELREGDLVVADVIGSEPVVSGSYTDPETVTIPPELQAQIDELAAQVNDNSEQVANAQAASDQAAIVAQSAIDLAATADGRVSISDYDPGPEDVAGRNEGSIWFTRTRNRQNYCYNPSFEVDTQTWYPVECSIARVADTSSIDGNYVLEVTNSGVSGLHYLQWNGVQVASEGQIWAVSTYAKLMSGVATGVVMSVSYYDSTPAVIGVYYDASMTFDLTSEWQRIYNIIPPAPAGTAYIVVNIVFPTGTEGTVWRMDGALFELSETVDRYFDGDTYDGSWLGTPNLSPSVLEGGKVTKLFELDNGQWVLKQFMGDTLQDINASEINTGYMDGERIQDYSIPQDKMSGSPGIAAETLTAGNLVYIYNLAGVPKIYKADADNNRPANGFILVGAAAGEIVQVYSHGYNPFMTGLVPGPVYLSTTAGAASNAPSIVAGTLSQRVGFALSSTLINFVYSPSTRLT